MNDHDAIRRALDDLVGTPPLAFSRKGAVMARIHARRHARLAATAVIGTAMLAFASVGTLRAIQPEPAGLDHLVQDPTPSDKHTEKPARKPTAKPAPKPTEQPAVKPSPEPEPVKTKPVVEPTATPAKEASGLAMEFYVATESPTAGTPVDLKVKAYDGAGRVLRVHVDFGDGKSMVLEPTDACSKYGAELRQYFTHTYAKAGSYPARARVTTGSCGAATETKLRSVEVTIKTAAEKATNGPSAPTVAAQKSVAAAVMSLTVNGSDADGFVKKFWIDWGDGSPETYLGPRSLDSCQVADGTTHPKPTSWQQSSDHEYAAPGTYTVKVVVMSTSCEGTEGQTATTTLTVSV